MLNAALMFTYAPRVYRAGGDPVVAPALPGPAPTVSLSPVVATTATPTTVLIHVEGLSANPNDPTYVQLRAAFTNARLSGADDRQRGNWIGPGPRVTRADDSAPVSYKVSAAWVYQFPTTGASTNALIADLAANVLREMGSLATLSSAGWHVHVSPYNAGVNGPLSWWACTAGGDDCAQVTRTRDTQTIPGVLTDADENPIGPTTARTHPSTAPDTMKTAVTWAIGLGVVGVGGWLAIQAYSASKAAKRAAPAKDEV